MRRQIFRSWYVRLWTVWVIILFGDNLIAWLFTKSGYPMEEAEAWPISLLIGLIICALWMALLERYHEHQMTVPDRDRLPRGPSTPAEETQRWDNYPEWDYPGDAESEDEFPLHLGELHRDRGQTQASKPENVIELSRLTLLVRQSDSRLRYDRMVRPEDMAIRPFLQCVIPKGSPLIGKILTIRFKILAPRHRVNPEWTLDDQVFFDEAGQYDIWPQNDEYLIAGRARELGTWRLVLELVSSDLVRPWTSVKFRITEYSDVVSCHLGDDATLSNGARRKIAASIPKDTSLDDIFGRGS